ncbi:MAG: hypothetical protein A2066_09240 [Bacteroidetes bacterium GWB2_41_8]|nr:MAG: hypothetical protein A2066_09240 [Bacteroidetes bacterium GWB2_41_8]
MTIYKIEFDLRGKVIELDNKYYRFENGNCLTINDLDSSIQGTYNLVKKGERYFLLTDPEIIKGKKELPIDLLLNDSIILVNE